MLFHANNRASRGCEEAGTGVVFDSGVEGDGERVERRVSGRPGAEGAVVELVECVVRLLADVGCAGRGAIRRDYEGEEWLAGKEKGDENVCIGKRYGVDDGSGNRFKRLTISG